MSTMNRRLAFGALLLAIAFFGGYLALVSYASGKAEDELEHWFFQNRLEDKVSWKGVGATPLGGRITITGLRFDATYEWAGAITLDVEKLEILEARDDRDGVALELKFSGASIFEAHEGSATTPLQHLTYGSGRATLPPLSGKVKLNYERLRRAFALHLETDVPDMFAARVSLKLLRLPEPQETLEDISKLLGHRRGDGMGSLLALQSIPVILERLGSIEIGGAELTFRDEGYFQRVRLIEQRYKMLADMDPEAGDAKKQHQVYVEHHKARLVADCERELREVPTGTILGSCDKWATFLVTGSGGFEASVSPKRPIRLSDLQRVLEFDGKGPHPFERFSLMVRPL